MDIETQIRGWLFIRLADSTAWFRYRKVNQMSQSTQPQVVVAWMEANGFEWLPHKQGFPTAFKGYWVLKSKPSDHGITSDQALFFYTICQKVEQAYGGCHNCYGKGYASVNDRWLGHDTDTDIGSPGGYVSGGDPNAMKFCRCDRGRELKARFQKAEREAQLAILKKVGQAYHKEEYQDKAREALSFALWAEIDKLEAQLTPPQDTKEK